MVNKFLPAAMAAVGFVGVATAPSFGAQAARLGRSSTSLSVQPGSHVTQQQYLCDPNSGAVLLSGQLTFEFDPTLVQFDSVTGMNGYSASYSFSDSPGFVTLQFSSLAIALSSSVAVPAATGDVVFATVQTSTLEGKSGTSVTRLFADPNGPNGGDVLHALDDQGPFDVPASKIDEANPNVSVEVGGIATPEPRTTALFMTGGLSVVLYAWRRNRAVPR